MFYLYCVETNEYVGLDREGYPHRMTEKDAHSGAFLVHGWETKEKALSFLNGIRSWVFVVPKRLYNDFTWEVVRQNITYEVV